MRLLFITLLSSFLIACEPNNGGQVCTEQFVSITIEVKNQSNEGVTLDSAQVLLLNNNSDITKEVQLDSFDNGIYIIANDRFLAEASKAILNIRFKGYLNEQLVVDEPYEIGSDGCHIYLISGKQQIII